MTFKQRTSNHGRYIDLKKIIPIEPNEAPTVAFLYYLF